MKIKNLGKIALGMVALTGAIALTSCDSTKKDKNDDVIEVEQNSSLKVENDYGVMPVASYSDTDLFNYAKSHINDVDFGWGCKLYLYTMCPNLTFSLSSKEVVNKMYWVNSDGDYGYDCEQIADKTETIFEKGKLYHFKLTGESSFYMKSLDRVIQEFMHTTIVNLRSKGYFYSTWNIDLKDDGIFYDDGNDYTRAIADKMYNAMKTGVINEHILDADGTMDDFFSHFAYFIPNQTFEISSKLASEYAIDDMLEYGLEIVEYSLLDFGDTIKPEFTNNDYYIPVSVDNPLTTDEIKAKITATDETDGNVSSRVNLVSTTYNYNSIIQKDSSQLGIHTFNVNVSDTSGNVNTATFYIRVYDIVEPEITGNNHIKLSYDSTKLDMDDVGKNNLTITDNWCSSGDLSLILKSDTYTSHYNQVGNYELVFYATDTTGNKSQDFTILVEVVDEYAPVIVAPSIIDCNNTTLLSLDEIKSKISVEDGYDGVINYTLSGYNDYQSGYKIVGDYNLTISATDSSGNTSTHTITLKNSDKIAPDFFVPRDFVIVITKGQTLTNEMILQYLYGIGEIKEGAVETMECDYVDETGSYAVKVFLTDGSIYQASIYVNDKPVVEEELNWWESMWKNVGDWFNGIGDWFKNIWENICNWFKDVFTTDDEEKVVDEDNEKDVVVPEGENDSIIAKEEFVPHYTEDGILDNQFLVYEYPEFDCGDGVPATMPDGDSVILG